MAKTKQLTANATLTSGVVTDVTTQATWTSSDPTIATVDSAGMVTAVKVGTCTVTAAMTGMSGTCTVTVTDPLLGLLVTPVATVLTVK